MRVALEIDRIGPGDKTDFSEIVNNRFKTRTYMAVGEDRVHCAFPLAYWLRR